MSRCTVYDAECINEHYCMAHGACCAGDPECKPAPDKDATIAALRAALREACEIAAPRSQLNVNGRTLGDHLAELRKLAEE